jgi:hypothetical protein
MIRKALLLVPVLALAASAHAQAPGQFSVYGTVTLDHLTGVNSSPILQTLSPAPCTGSATATANCTAYKSSVDPIGFTGGVSYDIKQFGPVLLSADVRAVVASSHQGAQKSAEGAGTHIYSYLGGVRGTFHTPLTILRPYAQVSAGYARSNYGVLTDAGVTNSGNPTFPGVATQNAIEYHVFAGADLRVLPLADWRVVELGYGALQSSGNFSHNYPLYTISTGIVLHFPPRP